MGLNDSGKLGLAWIVRSDYKSLDPFVLVLLKCGIPMIYESRKSSVENNMASHWTLKEEYIGLGDFIITSDSISFSHRITLIRAGSNSIACKDTTNEWYVWRKGRI